VTPAGATPRPDRSSASDASPRPDRPPAPGASPRPDRSPASDDKPLPDVGGPGLDVLFCGINPSLLSAETGHHFARPGNRFWPALHGAGFTPRRFSPAEDGLLPALGVGITNVCARPTRAASELSDAELHEGWAQLESLCAAWSPGVVAVVGIGAWRTCTGERDAGVGPQSRAVGGRPAWVLPNPSGLNAHFQLPDLVRLFGALRDAVGHG
jgi:double-stranded uracil-DNA glycosylase